MWSENSIGCFRFWLIIIFCCAFIGCREPGRRSQISQEKTGQSSSVSARITDQLIGLGYLSAYREAPETRGVTQCDPEQAYNGLNLVTSGHEPEAFLMDMEGTIFHRWSYAFERLGLPVKDEAVDHIGKNWRKVVLLEDGDLLAIYDWRCLIRLDRDSRLKWQSSHYFHHDVYVAAQDRFITLETVVESFADIQEGSPIYNDYITVLSGAGEVLKRTSMVKLFRNSPWSDLIRREDNEYPADVFHTNRIIELDGSWEYLDPAFRAGNLLVSLRSYSTLAVIDPEEETIVWAISGPWKHQHDPSLMVAGSILLFDNEGESSRSRVIEYDPWTEKITWQYSGTSDDCFYSECCSTAQRLPNGNTLITVSEIGKAFEITPANDVVWEFVNPHGVDNKNGMIATLFQCERIVESNRVSWLTGTAMITPLTRISEE